MQHLLQSGLELSCSFLIIGENIGGAWRANPVQPSSLSLYAHEVLAHWEMCMLLSEANTFKATLPLWRFRCLFPLPHDIFMQIWILGIPVYVLYITRSWTGVVGFSQPCVQTPISGSLMSSGKSSFKSLHQSKVFFWWFVLFCVNNF